jgi:hypothetical protein
MGSLPIDIVLMVQDALLVGTTFAQFVSNTRYLGFGEKRAHALQAWLGMQCVGDSAEPFTGTAEELRMLSDHMESQLFYAAVEVCGLTSKQYLMRTGSC